MKHEYTNASPGDDSIFSKIFRNLGEKLVNYWLDKLESKPECHDKVEFEIVQSCFPLGFEDEFKNEYQGDVLTNSEYSIFFESLLIKTSVIN